MPSPLELLLDPISLSILALYALLMIVEACFPARSLPVVKYWKIRGIAAFFTFFYLSSYLPLLCAAFLPEVQLINLSGLNVGVAAFAGIIMYMLGQYLWHRAMHSNNVLWRIFHQMHHSAERLDTYGAFYFSPFDMVSWIALSTVCFAVILGLPPQAITVILLTTNFFSIFQHANIKTPQWLGYIIQRPESHAYHHAKQIHRHNYCDLPIFDMLFGTFHNPESFEHEAGFYQGASDRVGDMLMFKDVSQPERIQD